MTFHFSIFMKDHELAQYVQLTELKDHLEVCLTYSRLLSGHSKLPRTIKIKVAFHENDSVSISSQQI